MGGSGGCIWSLSQALLCVLNLGCARWGGQVAPGSQAGFLLQALAAAHDVLEGAPDPLPGTWVTSMLAQPLVAFGLHRLHGDGATANLLLGGATMLAPTVAMQLPLEGRLLAARAIALLTGASLTSLGGLTGNAASALGGLLVAIGPLVPPMGQPWVLGASSLALGWALRAS